MIFWNSELPEWFLLVDHVRWGPWIRTGYGFHILYENCEADPTFYWINTLAGCTLDQGWTTLQLFKCCWTLPPIACFHWSCLLLSMGKAICWHQRSKYHFPYWARRHWYRRKWFRTFPLQYHGLLMFRFSIAFPVWEGENLSDQSAQPLENDGFKLIPGTLRKLGMVFLTSLVLSC